MFGPTRILPLLVLALSANLVAQQSEAEYLLEGSRAVNEQRYAEIGGSPYRYTSFRPAVLLDAVLNEYSLDSVNYNGFTGRFEYISKGELRELSQRNFLRATIADEDGTNHVYVWSVNPRFSDRYAELLYQGDFVTATLVYAAVADEKATQTPGTAAKGRRFNVKRYYYAIVDGELTTLSARARKLAAELGHERKIRNFIKDNDLRPGRRKDLIEVLAYADGLF